MSDFEKGILTGVIILFSLIFFFIFLFVKTYEPDIRLRSIEVLADNIYFEARNSTLEDKVAVAVATLNRVKSDKFPNTVEEVVFQPNQFSWTSEYLEPAKNKSWEECRAIAEMVYDNHDTFKQKNICFHYASSLDYPSNHWTHKMKKKTKIGKHWYFCD